MNFEGPLIVGFNHYLPHPYQTEEVYLYKITAYITLGTEFVSSLCFMNDSITFFSLFIRLIKLF